MKKITCLILLMLFTLVGYSQIIGTGFENGMPSGWLISHTGAGNNQWNVNTASLGNSGSSCIMVTPGATTPTAPIEDWVITSSVNLTGIINPKVSFYGKVNAGPTRNTKLEVRISTTNNALTSFNNVLAIYDDYNTNATNPISSVGGTYGFKELSLLPYVGQTIYIAFVVVNEGSGKTWFLDDISVFEDCPDPINLGITNITATSATATWGNPLNAPSFEIDVMLESESPTSFTADFTSTSTSQLLSGLSANSLYKYYIRSICGTNGSGDWIGPFSFGTTPFAAELTYTENFENYHGWQFVNGTQVNKWYVGTAVNNGGSKAMYISNNDGVNNNYTITTASTTHAYRDVVVPAGISQLQITFDWRAVGQTTTDRLRVWLAPTTFVPTAGTQITTTGEVIQIGGNFSSQADWTTYSSIVDLTTTMAGTNRRIIFEWVNNAATGTQPPAAIDNLVVKAITCSAPTNLVLGVVTQNTAVVSWTPPIGAIPSSYDYFVTSTNIPPAENAPADGNVTGTTVTIQALQPGQIYYVWIRGNCGTNNGNSLLLGPLNFSTTQSASTLPYQENFDSESVSFGLNNGTQVNKWIVGSDAFVSPNKALYISNNFVNNTYTITSASVTHAYKDIIIDAGTAQLDVTFDWRAVGQTTTDRMRVWLVSNTFIPTPGTAIPTGGDRIQIGANYSAQANWTTVHNVVNIPATVAGTSRRLVFEWINDATTGTQTPAAVDNIKVKVLTCSMPSNLVLTSVGQDNALISWAAPATSVPTSYDYFVSTTNTPPSDTATPTGSVTSTTATLEGLEPGQTYYVWVRGNCGTLNGNSYSIGPVVFTTYQIPATLPYLENFDSSNPVFGFVNGTQVNKWIIGSDTFVSPSKSMYISNDDVNNIYTITTASVTHAYRDFHITDGAGEMQVSFDWRAVGQTTTDRMRVWLAPITFNPVAGTQITAVNGIQQIEGNFSQQGTWINFTSSIDVTNLADTNRRIIFEWRNDASGGTQTPAAIDNLNLIILPCSTPSALTLVTVNQSSATLQWTEPINNAPSSYDYFVSTTNTPPTNLTTPTGNVVGNTVTIDGLNPSQTYYFWVRGNCGDSNSNLLGPISFTTSQIPGELNFFDGFEGQSEFTLSNNTTLPNKWIIGNAVSASGNKSLYISNDGQAFQYTIATSITVVHAYRDIHIPEGTTTDIAFSYDWRNQGENNADYLRVWLVPVTYTPIVGTQITAANSGGVQLGGNHQLSNVWKNATYIYPGPTYAGQYVRLVFEWRNSASSGAQSPAAIDNVEVRALTCPAPIELQAVNGPNGTLRLIWDPVGTETQWEVVILPAESGTPGNAPANSVIVNGNPMYTFTPQEGVLYEFYVRAKCSDSDISLWSGPERFSIFRPEACADLDISPLDLNVNADGDYVVCDGESVTVELDANYDASSFKATTSYDVESIEYNPPFPFTGGIQMDITTDDRWSPEFTLPFDFCFFGEEYNKVKVGSNGIIGFSVPTADTSCPYAFTAQVPSTAFAAEVRNAIYGVYQDINPATNSLPLTQNKSINYQVLGTYPCRALVVNFNDILQFSCGASTGVQTSQIVLYEITNIIEVYVKRRVPCTSWQGGRGVIGIQNAEGTVGYTPPGRNTGAWSAENEAWRFKPSGPTTPTFGWYQDGVLISNEPVVSVEIGSTTNFEAVVSFPGCGADDLVLRKGFEVKVSEEIILPQADEIVICVNNLDDSERGRISDNDEIILSRLGNPANFTMTYYHSEANAEAGINQISNPDEYVPSSFPEVIFVKVQNNETGCYAITSFNVREGIVPELDLKDVLICTNFELPVLASNQKYLMFEVLDPVNQSVVTDTKIEPQSGRILEIGFYQIYVEVESEDKCVEIYSYKVSVVPCTIPKGISPNGDGLNDYLDLTYYMAQDVKIFNRYGKVVYSHGPGYTNQWHGQSNSGSDLPSGTYFYNIVTPFETFTGWIQLVKEQN